MYDGNNVKQQGRTISIYKQNEIDSDRLTDRAHDTQVQLELSMSCLIKDTLQCTRCT
jgi:hypothetical protein